MSSRSRASTCMKRRVSTSLPSNDEVLDHDRADGEDPLAGLGRRHWGCRSATLHSASCVGVRRPAILDVNRAAVGQHEGARLGRIVGPQRAVDLVIDCASAANCVGSRVHAAGLAQLADGQLGHDRRGCTTAGRRRRDARGLRHVAAGIAGAEVGAAHVDADAEIARPAAAATAADEGHDQGDEAAATCHRATTSRDDRAQPRRCGS